MNKKQIKALFETPIEIDAYALTGFIKKAGNYDSILFSENSCSNWRSISRTIILDATPMFRSICPADGKEYPFVRLVLASSESDTQDL
jgi:hypothetical protein